MCEHVYLCRTDNNGGNAVLCNGHKPRLPVSLRRNLDKRSQTGVLYRQSESQQLSRSYIDRFQHVRQFSVASNILPWIFFSVLQRCG